MEDKVNDLAFVDEVVSEHKKKWLRGTRKLTLGVAFSTALMVLYSVLLFVPLHTSGNNDPMTTRNLLLYMLYGVVAIAIAFLSVHNYLRGLARFTIVFGAGGRRSLALIRWGYVLTIAGVVLQMLVFFVFGAGSNSITFGRLILGNVVLVAAAATGIAGFLALATVKGMTDRGRKGALHMSWTTLVILAGAILLSFAIHKGLFLKILCTLINITGACLFYAQWKKILAWPEQEEQTEQTEQAPHAESKQEEPTERV